MACPTQPIGYLLTNKPPAPIAPFGNNRPANAPLFHIAQCSKEAMVFILRTTD